MQLLDIKYHILVKYKTDEPLDVFQNNNIVLIDGLISRTPRANKYLKISYHKIKKVTTFEIIDIEREKKYDEPVINYYTLNYVTKRLILRGFVELGINIQSLL